MLMKHHGSQPTKVVNSYHAGSNDSRKENFPTTLVTLQKFFLKNIHKINDGITVLGVRLQLIANSRIWFL